jgi:hypothetical protein
MPAGIVRSAIPTAVLPLSLSRAFVESQAYPARVNEYHDGSSQRTAMLASARRSWQLAKHLPAASMSDLLDFWQAQGIGGFYFYNPKETSPAFSCDPTGAAVAGRYRVRFASAWSQTVGIGMSDANVELVEIFDANLFLADDLAVLFDRSTSMTTTDLANERAAAKSIVDLCAPLSGGGITAYAFAGGVSQLIAVSHDVTAIKAAIDGATSLMNSTSIYDCIYQAAATTAKYIVLMTDGGDNSSSHTKDQAIAYCVARGVEVYTVGFGSAVDPTVLTDIATGTGGAFYPSSTSGGLSAIVASILREVA